MPALSLMPFEKEVVTFGQPFGCLMAGRGAGKTHAIQCRLKYRSTKYAKLRSMYLSPIFGQGLEVFLEMLGDREFMKFVKRFTMRPYPKFTLKNGSRIIFRSFARPQSVRSTGEDEMYMDESQDPAYTEYLYDSIIAPMIGRRQSPAGGRGILLMSGQFRGEDWRMERFWKPGTTMNDDGTLNTAYKPRTFKAWRIPSSEGYSYKTPGGADRLELIKNSTPKAIWEQEWECIPKANQFACFPAEEVDRISIKHHTPIVLEKIGDKPKKRSYVCGVDLGKRVDPTAVVVMDDSGNVVYNELFTLNQPHRISARKAAQIAKHFNASMYVDCTGGGNPARQVEESYTMLYRNIAEDIGVLTFRAFIWNFSNKKRIIESMGLAIQEGRMAIPAQGCETLLKQLKAYECRESKNGLFYQFMGPNGHNDDMVAALALAWEGVRLKDYPDPNGRPYVNG